MRFHRDGGSGKSSKRPGVLLLIVTPRRVGGAGLLRYWFESMLERPSLPDGPGLLLRFDSLPGGTGRESGTALLEWSTLRGPSLPAGPGLLLRFNSLPGGTGRESGTALLEWSTLRGPSLPAGPGLLLRFNSLPGGSGRESGTALLEGWLNSTRASLSGRGFPLRFDSLPEGSWSRTMLLECWFKSTLTRASLSAGRGFLLRFESVSGGSRRGSRTMLLECWFRSTRASPAGGEGFLRTGSGLPPTGNSRESGSGLSRSEFNCPPRRCLNELESRTDLGASNSPGRA
jgi:hypothetical protein